MEVISKNKIKWIRSLRLKKNRDAEQLFVVEGAKMVQEIIDQFPKYIECVVATDKNFEFNGAIYFAENASMKEMTALKTASSLLAVVKMPKIKPDQNGFMLAIDGIQDPGNLGTIIRTADWFGVTTILCSKETVDVFNPKVIQSSMGSLFRVSCQYLDLKTYLSQTDRPIYGALMEGKSMGDIALASNGILVMGNEGNGVSESIQEEITDPIHIPGKGGAESLNVAVAAGILMSRLNFK